MPIVEHSTVHDLMKFFISSFALFLVLFLDGLGLGLVFPMLNSILIDPQTSFLSVDTSMQLRNILYGVVVGSFMLSWFFGAPILGDLSDTVGRKKGLLICLIGAILGYFLSGVGVAAMSIGWLITGRIIAGLTSGSQAIAQAAIVDLSTPETKSRNIGYILLSVSLGFIVGPMLGGFLSNKEIVPWFTFSTPFYFAALLSFLNTLFLLFFFKETFKQVRKIKITPHHAIVIFLSAFRHRTIRYLSIFFLVFLLGWSNYYTYISMFLFKKYGFQTLDVTIFMSLLGLGFGIGFGLLPGFCARKMGLKGSVGISIALAALFALVTVATPEPIYAWLSVVPIGIATSVGYANGISIISNQVDSDAQGWIMGVTGAIMALSFGIVGLSAGVVVKESEDIPIILSFVLMLISAVLISFYRGAKSIHRPK